MKYDYKNKIPFISTMKRDIFSIDIKNIKYEKKIYEKNLPYNFFIA